MGDYEEWINGNRMKCNSPVSVMVHSKNYAKNLS